MASNRARWITAIRCGSVHSELHLSINTVTFCIRICSFVCCFFLSVWPDKTSKALPCLSYTFISQWLPYHRQRSIFTLLISSFNRMTFAFLSFYRSFHINVLCLLILFVSSSLFHFFVLITLTHKVVYSQQFRNWAEYLVLYRREKKQRFRIIFICLMYITLEIKMNCC